MKGGGDQELCLAASPERSYLFHSGVHSLLQPSGLDRERSAFPFAFPPAIWNSVDRADKKMKVRKGTLIRNDTVRTRIQLPPFVIGQNVGFLGSAYLMRFNSVCNSIMCMLQRWIISQSYAIGRNKGTRCYVVHTAQQSRLLNII